MARTMHNKRGSLDMGTIFDRARQEPEPLPPLEIEAPEAPGSEEAQQTNEEPIQRKHVYRYKTPNGGGIYITTTDTIEAARSELQSRFGDVISIQKESRQ